MRELRNIIRRAILMESAQIDTRHLKFHQLTGISRPEPRPAPLEDRAWDEDYIRAALQRHGNNRTAVAQELGISRSTLLYRLKKLGIR